MLLKYCLTKLTNQQWVVMLELTLSKKAVIIALGVVLAGAIQCTANYNIFERQTQNLRKYGRRKTAWFQTLT